MAGLESNSKESKIAQLRHFIERFRINKSQYTSSSYDEANLRVDFIDNFFEILDWDVRNLQGYSEDYREVVREDSIRIEGKPKAPDYSFRIGKERKFFVEAKKPSVNIKEDIDPAYQIRRYGYTAKMPLSILTDFQEFAVYDTRIKPAHTDSSAKARVFYCTYEEYENNFNFIYNTFSKNAILRGSFDRYVSENKNKKGTSEVDKEFLKLISAWREELAKNIAIRNKELDIYQLNSAIQKIIDRLIFLRIAEDRGTERYGTLKEHIKDEGYASLKKMFADANDKYNSEIFKNDDFLNALFIDDSVLKSMIIGMYYPDCPYEFSVMPIEVLGNIYEQFLGKTIRLTTGHQAKIEEKPEVRKAGGVYYTPQYIVNYIVENTVGEKIKGKKPEEIAGLKIVDPACGSGSFLIGAYNCLLEHHLIFYMKEKNLRKAIREGKVFQVKENEYHLTIEEKQMILLNNIFGVDIDPQAVEVTKLSLLLKLMENETKESEGELFKHSDLKLLPNLAENIKCGNSLIGSDFYRDKELPLFGLEEMRKVNAFDWDGKDGFPKIMKAGGFDVVIGNPPWGAELIGIEKEYLAKKYESYEYQFNSFSLFIEKGSRLLKNEGKISYIIPAVYLAQHYFSKIRGFILKNYKLEKVILINYKVFEDADTGDTSIFLLSRNNNMNQFVQYVILKFKNDFKGLKYNKKNQSEFLANSRYEINILLNKSLFDKVLNKSISLGEIATCIMGIKPYQTGKGNPKQTEKIVKERVFDSNKKIGNNYKQYLIGKDIERYIINPVENKFIKYGEWLAEPRFTAPFERTKIILRQTSDIIRAVIDNEHFYNLNNIYNIELTNTDLKYNYVLGILNSKLMVYIYQILVPEKGRVFAEIKKVNLDKLPIRNIDFSNTDENNAHDSLVALVDQMIETKKLIHSAKTETDKKLYQQKADLIDRQIDDLVYKLYGLIEEEIKIVEGNL